jgi:hypothetical protein
MTVGPFDLRFVVLFNELYALEKYMDSIESQLADLSKKEEEKAYDMLRQKGYENDEIERHQIHQELYELIKEVLPRYFLSSILVTLWAIFESAINEIAKEVRDQQSQPIKLRDINGDFLKRTKKYFNHIIKIPLNTGGSSWQHLQMFCVLRNAIVHANGRFENLKHEKDINNIKKWSKDKIGIQEINGILLFSSDFVKETYVIVFEMLSDLTEIVKIKYPEPIH